jgi:hypothetical protein
MTIYIMEMNNTTRTPRRLQATRLAAGLSREALARQCSPPISAQSVRNAEYGMCSDAMAQRIASALSAALGTTLTPEDSR